MSKKPEYPEVGDLVVGTVSRIMPYGAYVTLDEFGGKEGLLHISEISSTWVKNIRDHVREGQKVVLKVLRVDPDKGHIDLSLRRVSGRERKEKMLAYKREKKAISIIKMAGERLGEDPESFFEKVAPVIEEEYGELHPALEEVVEKGSKVLVKLGLPEDWAEAIYQLSKERIKPPRVRIRGFFELVCYRPDGVKAVKNALMAAQSVKKPRDCEIKIYVLGTPRYRIEVYAKNYKDAEKALKAAVDEALKTIESAGGRGSFTRE